MALLLNVASSIGFEGAERWGFKRCLFLFRHFLVSADGLFSIAAIGGALIRVVTLAKIRHEPFSHYLGVQGLQYCASSDDE